MQDRARSARRAGRFQGLHGESRGTFEGIFGGYVGDEGSVGGPRVQRDLYECL